LIGRALPVARPGLPWRKRCRERRREAPLNGPLHPNIRVAISNIIAGGVGITLTAGTHVIDLDWVPANHAQAEDRCYRLGQTKRVTVEYFRAEGSLDGRYRRMARDRRESHLRRDDGRQSHHC
jgi:hypothetical protein